MHIRCRIYGSKSTRKRLAAGLRPDPLGELERSPRPLAAKGGGVKGGEGKGKEKGREGRGREGPHIFCCNSTTASTYNQLKVKVRSDFGCKLKLLVTSVFV